MAHCPPLVPVSGSPDPDPNAQVCVDDGDIKLSPHWIEEEGLEIAANGDVVYHHLFGPEARFKNALDEWCRETDWTDPTLEIAHLSQIRNFHRKWLRVRNRLLWEEFAARQKLTEGISFQLACIRSDPSWFLGQDPLQMYPVEPREWEESILNQRFARVRKLAGKRGRE